MDCSKNKEMLQAYLDKELGKENEANLFNHLSECSDCRAYFKSLIIISDNLEKREYPSELDERILYSIKGKESKRLNGFFMGKFIPAFSYALAVILVAVSIILFSEINNYKNEISSVNRKVLEQSQTLELLYNSLSSAEVTGKVENTIIVKPKKM